MMVKYKYLKAGDLWEMMKCVVNVWNDAEVVKLTRFCLGFPRISRPMIEQSSYIPISDYNLNILLQIRPKYGQIHCIVKSLVNKNYGDKMWSKIISKCKLDEYSDFMTFGYYKEETTIKLIECCCECLGLTMSALMEAFGAHFYRYCCDTGYNNMLKTLGTDMASFISNLDSLHSLLSFSYSQMVPPSFRCEIDEKDNSIKVHYYSQRSATFSPVVVGILKEVAKDLFNIRVEIEVVSFAKACPEEGLPPRAMLLITSTDKRELLMKERRISLMKHPIKANDFQVPLSSHIGARDFCILCPYHVIFDKTLEIKQAGRKLQTLSGGCCIGDHVDKWFSVIRPNVKLTFENVLHFINGIWMLEVAIAGNNKTGTKLVIKGCMNQLENGGIIFNGSPRLKNLNELAEKGMRMSDIEKYDVTRELVLLNEQRIAEMEVSKALDKTTAQLKRTSSDLANEKSKSEMLLHQMLPRKVARQLMEGRHVEAEKYGEGTILFSDIVTFTDIASACQPMDVVNMLNELYSLFDKLTTEYAVYKVETIGDAYMVVGGVPEVASDHAEKVACMGLGMISEAKKIYSPKSQEPLQIRVGIHSGPIVAGVVGDKMPRYCLFGDTVNTASRMESHGFPSMVHLSSQTYTKLKDRGFYMENRGLIPVKGKGKMNTYFLVGKQEDSDEWARKNSYMQRVYAAWCEARAREMQKRHSQMINMPIMGVKAQSAEVTGVTTGGDAMDNGIKRNRLLSKSANNQEKH